MEEQLVTAVMMLDLSAAFNTVDHDLLLEVLEKRFGVTDKAKQWYCNYIKQRKFSVIIGKNKSESRQLKCSVSQGSTQGAFLFISYASTLDEIVKDLKLNGFADDHSVRKTFKPDRLEHHQELNTIAIIEKSMLDIKSWMDAVTPSRCIRIMMSNISSDMNKPCWKLAKACPQSQILFCSEFIYFGGSKQLEKCIISPINDPTLNLEHHIKIKCKAAMLNLLKIKATRKYLATEACSKAVITLVMSHLDYTNSTLTGLPKASICQLQRVQNMAAKIILQRNNLRVYQNA